VTESTIVVGEPKASPPAPTFKRLRVRPPYSSLTCSDLTVTQEWTKVPLARVEEFRNAASQNRMLYDLEVEE
jgi:hypothetical protein